LSLLRSRAETTALIVSLALASQTLLVLLPLAVATAFFASNRTRRHLATWPLWLLMLTLALVNSLKWPESDLADYYRFVDHVVGTPLSQVFMTDESFISISPYELLFKTFVALLSPLGAAAKITFTAISTLLIYGSCALIGRWMIAGYERASGGLGRTVTSSLQSSLTISAAILIGITFSVTAHLTRQYLAGACFFIGLFLFLLHRRTVWMLPCLLALLVHRSAAVLVVPLFLLLIYRRWPLAAWLGVLAVLVLGLFNPLSLIFDLDLELTLLGNEGEQGPALMALDASVVIGATWIGRQAWLREDAPNAGDSERLAYVCRQLLMFATGFAAALYAAHEVPLVLFRSYFYIEFLRVPLLAMIIHAGLLQLRCARLAAVTGLVIVGALVCWARASGAEWQYADRGWVPWQLSEVIERWHRIEDNH
jgi:hypothetical protein